MKPENPNPELEEQLQAIADDQNVMVMSFIAPDTVVRRSPIAYDYATITVQDLYNIEAANEAARSKGPLPKKLHLVIQTPGGQVYAATKIARFLQATFTEIEAYVPYEAASGGTMLCLAANEIVMDNASNLTMIDPQTPYKGEYVAATSYAQAVDEFAGDEYKTKRLEELPPPYQAMIQKFDPIIRQQMEKMVFDTIIVAISLMNRGMNPKGEAELDQKITKAALFLGKTQFPHSHIVTREDAKGIGLSISDNHDKLETLKVYKRFVTSNLSEISTNHIVKYYCPKGGKDEQPDPSAEGTKPSKKQLEQPKE